MDRDEILEKVVEQVSEVLDVEVDEVDPEASLDDFDIDSIDRLEVLVALEDAFGIEIDQDSATQFKNVSALVDAIAALV